MGKMVLCCYRLLWKNCEHTKSIGTLHWSGIKFLIRNFTEVRIMNFIPHWESEIVNQSGLPKYLSENQCYCAKMRALEKENNFTEGFFIQVSRNPVRKRKVYKMMPVIQNSAIKYYHAFHVTSHKNSEM